MTEQLIDTDGENRAVRGFLLGLEANCKTFGLMRMHLTNYGIPSWPEHFNVAQGHITKAEQQEWLRHLFALDARAQPAQAVPVLSDAEMGEIINANWGIGVSQMARAVEQAVRAKLGAAVPMPGDQIFRIARRLAPKVIDGMVYVPEWIVPLVRAVEESHGIVGKEGA